LVDVLAFYVGLWSIDIKHLLYLIDDESAKRLSDYNPKYKGSPQVISRLNQAATSQNVLEALKALEEKVYNVLKYADFYLEERSNPTQYTNSLI
jgi:2,3-bisphosphoglycerate-independent phosphoglycerate mutase